VEQDGRRPGLGTDAPRVGRAARRPAETRLPIAPPLWLLVDSSRIGGIETHLLELAQALADRGVDALVVFYADHGPHPLRGALDDAALKHVSLGGTAASLAGALRRHRPRLIHTHGYKAGILARLIAPLFGIPVVSTFHAGEPGQGRVRAYLAIDRLTARLATCIAVSEPVARGLPSDTRIIRNFVRIPEHPAPRPSQASVAFVGRVEPEKGPDDFCEIAQRLPDVRFEMYGDGSMRTALEARHGHRVRFRGMVPSMAPYWGEVGLLCMPSRYEGLPMALLEAMANGVPVAAYAVGGLATSVLPGQTGWLAPAGDRASLVAAIDAWFNQGPAERDRMSQIARETVRARFSSSQAVDEILDVYAAALGR
jgi:glycosyltransferase involved in cell wall biosynthesis